MEELILPYLIEFSKIGNPTLGYISVAEKGNLPFIPKRIYWTYYTPADVSRGGHAHYQLVQILIAVAGKIIVNTEMITGEKNEFVLDRPNLGLLMPTMCWHNMHYTHNAVQISIASIEYDEHDYIRIYDDFKNLLG